MWDWLLNHWWVPSLVPYVVFNLYTVKWYRSDNNGVATVMDQIVLLLAGTWVVIAVFVAHVAVSIWETCGRRWRRALSK